MTEDELKEAQALDILLEGLVEAPEEKQQCDRYGRPTVITKSVLAKLRAAFLIGCTDLEACSSAGINAATLYRYQNSNPEFCELKKEWKDNPILKARNTVFNKLNEEATAKWYLERKAKNEFATRTESVNLTKEDLDRELDKMEPTNYDDVARQAQKQMVETNTSVQDQGQGGAIENVQPQHDAASPSSGESQPPVQPNS